MECLKKSDNFSMHKFLMNNKWFVTIHVDNRRNLEKRLKTDALETHICEEFNSEMKADEFIQKINNGW